jgi:hypothetical protein
MAHFYSRKFSENIIVKFSKYFSDGKFVSVNRILQIFLSEGNFLERKWVITFSYLWVYGWTSVSVRVIHFHYTAIISNAVGFSHCYSFTHQPCVFKNVKHALIKLTHSHTNKLHYTQNFIRVHPKRFCTCFEEQFVSFWHSSPTRDWASELCICMI